MTTTDTARIASGPRDDADQEDLKQRRDDLVVPNLPLVPFIAQRYAGLVQPDEFEDLIQEGNLGLMTAAERYCYALHFTRFSTYATFYIAQAIRAYLCNRGLIRLPREPKCLKGVNDDADLTPAQAAIYHDRMRAMAVGSPGGPTFDPVDDIRTPEEEVIHAEDLERLQGALEQINPALVAILLRRVGFFGRIDTLAQIGRELGVSRQQVRLWEKRGLALLAALMGADPKCCASLA